jgi:hypothetical protein
VAKNKDDKDIKFECEKLSRDFPTSCNQELKTLLGGNVNQATKFILEKTQLNLMYNHGQTFLSSQGSTKYIPIMIDNTRSMVAGSFMSALGRSKDASNVALLHPPSLLDDLKRDCKVNPKALNIEMKIQKQIKSRSVHDSDKEFLKYIFVNMDFD